MRYDQVCFCLYSGFSVSLYWTMTSTHNTPTARSVAGWVCRIPIDPMTYRSLAYLLLSIPLGMFYLVLITVGFSLSLGLLILIIGPVIFLLTLLTVVGFTWLDGKLTALLLEADVAYAVPRRSSLSTFLHDLVLSRATWLGLLFLGWKWVLGLVSLVFLVTGLSMTLSFLTFPFYYGEGAHVYTIQPFWEIGTFSGSLVVAGMGLIVGYTTLGLVNVLGHAARRIAEVLLIAD